MLPKSVFIVAPQELQIALHALKFRQAGVPPASSFR